MAGSSFLAMDGNDRRAPGVVDACGFGIAHSRSRHHDGAGSSHADEGAGADPAADMPSIEMASGPTARLVPLFLRLGVGVPELASSLEKLRHSSAFAAIWHNVHLPAAGILAPAYAAVGLCGALLLLAGWQTRAVAVLFVAGLVAEIVLTKPPLMRFGGWMLEWQSLWVLLVLASTGAGSCSLDGYLACRRPTRAVRPPSR